jgi:hypothetical protein
MFSHTTLARVPQVEDHCGSRWRDDVIHCTLLPRQRDAVAWGRESSQEQDGETRVCVGKPHDLSRFRPTLLFGSIFRSARASQSIETKSKDIRHSAT